MVNAGETGRERERERWKGTKKIYCTNVLENGFFIFYLINFLLKIFFFNQKIILKINLTLFLITLVEFV